MEDIERCGSMLM